MQRGKVSFRCSECLSVSLQWSGQCSSCSAWNSLSEVVETRHQAAIFSPKGGPSGISKICDISHENIQRRQTGISELDRVLGGGLVLGSVILLSGDPGIGKSTLALQLAAKQHEEIDTLYVTGEESSQQLVLRAKRLGISNLPIDVLAGNSLQSILEHISEYKLVVIDSIQALSSGNLTSLPGSVAQVRESAEAILRYAKNSECCVLMIGHVTKEGTLAGPKLLEHMVDTVLYFEGDDASRLRMIRSYKNRFGNVNEVGVFAMTGSGLQEVGNPSEMFLSRRVSDVPGSVVLATHQGTRPLLVEVQALLDASSLGNPRRLCVGLDAQRLMMLLAVLNRQSDVLVGAYDIFVNVVGGIRIVDSGADVALLAAIISSVLDKPFPRDVVCFGEIGLGGEIRPVQRGEDRIREASKLGYERVLVPKDNYTALETIEAQIIDIVSVSELVQWVEQNPS
ncbi:MAG: DNA repair protein RadA [Acidiferrobacteraceae bacterium]|nr:DNA repair protein RadA [Acidiferrobacteraceae bacterium]